MLSRNHTPFAAMGFAQLHRDSQTMACLAVRGSFYISPGGRLQLAYDQELVLADAYEGDPHRNSMRRATDLVRFKPSTDVTLISDTYPAAGSSSKS